MSTYAHHSPLLSPLSSLPSSFSQAMLKEKPEDEQPKPVIRPYTPVSAPDTKGHMDLVIKVKAGTQPKCFFLISPISIA